MSNVSEELLQLRKRARRRLVGAIALVIFALIVLWTALDGEPPANLAASRPVEIVSSSSNLASAVIAVSQPEASAPQATATPVAAATEVLPGQLINRQTEVDQALLEPTSLPKKIASSKPANKAVVAAKPTSKPTAKPTVKPTIKPVSRDPRSILEGRDEEAPAAHSAKFFVQVAAFADAAKANQIVAKLKKAGLPSYAEKVKTAQGELTRVRIGPADDRARAVEWLKKAQAQGVNGQVVSK